MLFILHAGDKKKMQETQIMKGKKSYLACRRWGCAGLAASLAALRWRKKEQISAEEKASSRLELLEGAATSVAAGRRRNQRAKGSGRSLFFFF